MKNKFIINLLKKLSGNSSSVKFILIAIVIAILAPLFFILSLNLLGLDIDYTFKSMVGAFLVLFLIGGFR